MKHINEKGEIIVLVIVIAAVVLVSVLILIGGAQLYYSNSNYAIETEKALSLAEAGVDKAIGSFNKVGSSYAGETETSLGDGSFSVTITTKDAVTKIIQSTGYLPNKTSPRVKRTIRIEASQGVGTSFVYGIQVGEGGLQLGNSNVVTGSIYSNGNISAGNNNIITGDAWVAGGSQPNPDQSTDCIDINCSDFTFGTVVNGDSRFDIAQSFKSSTGGNLNKISLKIKKTLNPSDATVRVIKDYGGVPDKRPGGILATGTLYSSLVTTNYGWVDVTFDGSPTLLSNTPYWIMVDTSSGLGNYWTWQNDTTAGYSNGSAVWSPDWQAGNPVWTTINGDLSFKTYLGGAPTSISGNGSFSVNGDVHAHTINGVTIGKNAYFQSLMNSTVGGSTHPGSSDPPPKVFPISDTNVNDWESQVNKAEYTTYGDINSCVSILGPRKIVGNVDFGSGCNITVKTPIWITGNLTLNSNNIVKLASEYGSTSGAIIVNGIITLNSNNHFQGTGNESSILMVLTSYDSRTNGIPAFQVNSNGNSGVFYASKGIMQPGTNNSFVELTAWGIQLINNSTINYTTGLSSTMFSSGPSGAYSLVSGTYQAK